MHLVIFSLLIIVSYKICVSENLAAYRLPQTIKPSHYDLLIITDLDEGQKYFKGIVSIQIIVLEKTNSFTLNVKELNITGANVIVKNITNSKYDKNIDILTTYLDKQNELFIITIEETLQVGLICIVKILFASDLKEALEGYYRSSYVDQLTGQLKWVAVTQFEPTAARKAFPCFDEPAFKATFTIRMVHKKHLKAISNMPLRKSSHLEERDGWVLDEFEKSLPMSSYLVAFMVSEMEYKEARGTQNRVMFRIWARKDAMDQVDFALDIGSRALTFYENYFEIKFPLPKQDLIAVPDFFQGAMENWGMITFRETELLGDKNSSFETKEEIAVTITHELAHQWFGNLVTMKWWSDLWLNEGFATYMEAACTNHLFPEFNTYYTSSIDNLITVMESDALRSSHQISVPIHDPKEIAEVFDNISYMKGSILIRMMVIFLGERIFRKGIINYLKAHSFSNAGQDNLWEALTASAHAAKVLENNVTVKEIMDSWTLQTGFPVLTVIRDYNSSRVIVKQKRYFALKNQSGIVKEDKSIWVIPLSYTTSSELNFKDNTVKKWFFSSEAIIENIAPHEDWIIFNINFGVLYKVHYDNQNWKKLAETLNNPKMYHRISAPNRVQLLNDVFDFAWDGDVDYVLAFNILNYIHHEVELLPWSVALRSTGKISGTITKTPTFGDFKKYMRKLIKPAFQKLKGFMDIPEKYEEQKIKLLITAHACNLELVGCLNQAIDLFQKWIKAPKPEDNHIIPEEYRSIVYCNVIRYGGEKEWNFLWSVYNQTNSAKHKHIIRSSLSCSREVWILNRFLFMLIDKRSGIRIQDSLSVFADVASNAIGFYLAKDFLYNNIHKIKKAYENSPSTLIGEFIPVLISQMTTETEINEMKIFLEKNKELFSPAKMSIQQSLESSQVTINWLKKNYDTVRNIVQSA